MTKPCCNNCARGRVCDADRIPPQGSRLSRLGGAISQAVNVLVFNGNPNESLSARAWRERRTGWIKWIDRLVFWEPRHCEKSHNTDVAWAQQIIDAKRT